MRAWCWGTLAVGVLVCLAGLRCGQAVLDPAHDGGSGARVSGAGGTGGTTGSGMGGIAGRGGDAGMGAAGGCGGASPGCAVTICGPFVRSCGDCIDNDEDGLVDLADPGCPGPCDEDERHLYVDNVCNTPPPCQVDCFFDHDCGYGNDQCFWNHQCDPLAVAPDYPPEGSECAYDPDAGAGPPGVTCSDAMTTQLPHCLDFCLPLVPNGCDCFGCCELPAESGNYVWVNSVDEHEHPTCELEHASDPSKCRPCTPVPSCINPCESCEICLGKPALEPGCGDVQVCPAGRQPCGLPCQGGCPNGEYCLTGCCVPAEQ